MENRWADPEGFEANPPPVRYRILGADGVLVERETEPAFDTGRRRHYHALRPQDQPFADAITALVQRACAYFYAGDETYTPLEGVADVVVPDADVRTRIERLDGGENTREAERTHLRSYPLAALPFDQQRALVEQIEALKRAWQFEILGPSQAAA